MTKIDTIIRHAEQQCKTHGVRLTEKRKRVLSALLHSKRALSAYEIADNLKSSYDEAIPAMSIYRILEFLQKEKLVHKLDLSNKYVACSHITCEHDHKISQFIICTQCHKVNEIMLSKSVFESFKESVEKAGFQFVCSQLEVKSICNNCA